MMVGMQEVRRKRAAWKSKGSADLQAFLAQHMVPTILGLGDADDLPAGAARTATRAPPIATRRIEDTALRQEGRAGEGRLRRGLFRSASSPASDAHSGAVHAPRSGGESARRGAYAVERASSGFRVIGSTGGSHRRRPGVVTI